jgi:hypothetical protein
MERELITARWLFLLAQFNVQTLQLPSFYKNRGDLVYEQSILGKVPHYIFQAVINVIRAMAGIILAMPHKQ